MITHTEKKIEAELRQGMLKIGGRCFKWVSPGNNGVPDRICIFPDGQVVFIEVKKPGGRLSAVQKRQLTKLIDLKQKIEVVGCMEDISYFFFIYGYVGYSNFLDSKYGLKWK